MNFFCILLTMLLGGIFMFSGCDESKDLYNPEHTQEKAKEAFPVKDMDPDQTWETSAVCNASVSIEEKTGETYTIKVYTANPYNTDNNPTLLATATVENGKAVNFKFDMPAALQYVYVMKVNSEGYSSAVPAAVENATVKVAFGGGGSGTTRTAMTRNATTQANDWQPNKLPQKAPEGSILLSDLNNQWNDVTKYGNYIVSSDTKEVNVGQPVNLYIKGEVTLTKLYIQRAWDAPAGEAKIYLLPHSKLTLVTGHNQPFSIQEGLEIGIADGAELACQEKITFNQKVRLYNCGTISIKQLEFNNNSHFINDGIVTVTSEFGCENDATRVENNGKINAGSLHLAGSSAFYNEPTGEVMISGQSNIDSNSSTWNNEGYFRTNGIVFKASSPNWINRCKLYVDGEFTYTPGNSSDNGFIMDAGAYAECKTLYADQAYIKMGNKAFFNVIGEAKFKHNPKGFITTGNEYALLKMGSAVQENTMQGFSITYNGRLHIACDNHFAQGNDGAVDHPLIDIKNGAQMTSADNAGISITQSGCNPGYNSIPDGGNGNNDKPLAYTYAFEDMMQEVGDYDFNDVMLYVTVPYAKDGKRYIDVTLKAAGASKLLAVHFNNNGTSRTIFDNVHEALGVSAGTIVNTGSATGTAKTERIEVESNFNLTDNGDLYISDGKRDIHIPNFTNGFKKGDVPYALRVASAWKWPKERIQITDAYAGFALWAQDATTETEWYNNPQSDKVME